MPKKKPAPPKPAPPPPPVKWVPPRSLAEELRAVLTTKSDSQYAVNCVKFIVNHGAEALQMLEMAEEVLQMADEIHRLRAQLERAIMADLPVLQEFVKSLKH